MKSDTTPYELESATTESELDPSELEPYELHPYELATLAARIARHLCAKHSTQLDAVYLATALIHVSSGVLNEIAAERTSKITRLEQHHKMFDEPEQAFRRTLQINAKPCRLSTCCFAHHWSC